MHRDEIAQTLHAGAPNKILVPKRSVAVGILLVLDMQG